MFLSHIKYVRMGGCTMPRSALRYHVINSGLKLPTTTAKKRVPLFGKREKVRILRRTFENLGSYVCDYRLVGLYMVLPSAV